MRSSPIAAVEAGSTSSLDFEMRRKKLIDDWQPGLLFEQMEIRHGLLLNAGISAGALISRSPTGGDLDRRHDLS